MILTSEGVSDEGSALVFSVPVVAGIPETLYFLLGCDIQRQNCHVLELLIALKVIGLIGMTDTAHSEAISEMFFFFH